MANDNDRNRNWKNDDSSDASRRESGGMGASSGRDHSSDSSRSREQVPRGDHASGMSGSQAGSQGNAERSRTDRPNAERSRTDRGNQEDEGIGSSATRDASSGSIDALGGTQNAGGSTGSVPNRGAESSTGRDANRDADRDAGRNRDRNDR